MKKLLKMFDKEVMMALSKHETYVPIYLGEEIIDVVKR